ncbi:ompW family protein [Pseudomonas fluorescens]|uniref:OmpW family protein n=1 Tax=Pseudomonas fluorescens TaxID=294 RepID=A0A0P8YKD8_PSEFL|nr:OmpW family outer membrane protein [Pseudomonas fluorescens]KPU52166.1 ompW family protein [Pseudomonas fluorescens]
MNKSMLSASLLALALAAPLAHAHAHEAGDIILRAGAITVNPKADSSSVKVDQGPLAGTNLGGKATMDSDTQLGLNFAYMITNNWGIELLAATPFEHDVKLKGTALPVANGKLGSLKHLPPTLSVVYYPLDSKSAFQPYVGGGINYTWIYDENLSSDAESAGFSNFKAKNSWGLAWQVGADYMLTDHVMLNAQVRYIDIDTRATVENNAIAPGTRAKVNVDVDPFVYMVGLGYKF